MKNSVLLLLFCGCYQLRDGSAQQPTSDSLFPSESPTGEMCGLFVTCDEGWICCNPKCGYCVYPGQGACNPEFCPYRGFCFSPYTKTNVMGKGNMMIKDIIVGDKILTGSGDFQTIYTMDHYHPSKTTDYIRITYSSSSSSPFLELTPGHMIYIDGKDDPLPASLIRIGDMLRSVNGPQIVTGLETITHNGRYNALTMDGTIVVGDGGIISSVYTSPTENAAHVKVFPGIMDDLFLLSFHSLVDMASVPYRSLCSTLSLDLCNRHDEISDPSLLIRSVFHFWNKQNEYVKVISLTVYVLFFGLLSVILKYSFLLMASSSAVFWRQGRRKWRKEDTKGNVLSQGGFTKKAPN